MSCANVQSLLSKTLQKTPNNQNKNQPLKILLRQWTTAHWTTAHSS